VRVRMPEGTKAWVFGDLIGVTSHVMRRVPVSKDFPALPVAVRASGNSPGLANIAASGDVASFAVQFVGYRYRWGGASPKSGFDCSGLTSYVYAQHGVSLPRTAASQYSGGGARIGSIDSLAPGDLVFFANTGGRRGISHVGIYIGGGRIVHAMTPRYGVQVSSLYERYWSSKFVGGVRPRR
jgi:cell wall-associated NlpC family hydrolase